MHFGFTFAQIDLRVNFWVLKMDCWLRGEGFVVRARDTTILTWMQKTSITSFFLITRTNTDFFDLVFFLFFRGLRPRVLHRHLRSSWSALFRERVIHRNHHQRSNEKPTTNIISLPLPEFISLHYHLPPPQIEGMENTNNNNIVE